MTGNLISRTSLKDMGLLLGVGNRLGRREHRRVRTLPVVTGLANIFFCGYFDHLVKEGTEGHNLALWISVELMFSFIVTVGFLIQRGKEILTKTTIYPVSHWSRLLFTIVSSVRNPPVLMQWLTSMIFLVVMYRTELMVMLWAILLTSLAIFTLVVLSGVIFLSATRSPRMMIALILFGVLLFPGVILSSTVLTSGFILLHVPIIAWAADGITGIQHGENTTAIFSTFLFFLVLASGLLYGKRLA